MLTTLSLIALATVPQQEVAPVGSLQALVVPTSPGMGSVRIDVNLGGVEATLELERYSLRATDFKVYASAPDGSLVELPAPAATSWRGRVRGMRDADVTASITGDGLTAIVYDYAGDQQWQIQPAEGQPVGVYSVAQPDSCV